MLIVVLTLDIDNAEKKTFRTASLEGRTFSTLEETAQKIYDFLPLFSATTVIVFVRKLMPKRYFSAKLFC